MPVTIKTGLPSNKTIIVICNQVHVDQPEVSLKLDKLSLTLPVKDVEDQHGIKTCLYDCARDPTAFAQKKGKGNRYKTNLRMFLPSGDHVLIQADPFKPTESFLRFEWNPSKAGLAGHEYMKIMMSTFLPDGYNGLLHHGRVTRADVALDIEGVNVNDLHFLPSRPLRTVIYKDAKGRTETLYLGDKRSTRYWRIYDKARHLNLPEGEEVTRVERVHKTGIPFKGLVTLDNPFQQLVLCDLGMAKAHPLVESWVWRLFQEACRHSGINATLAGLPKPVRLKFRTALKASTTAWWQPQKFWQQWPKMLDDLELLKPCGF